MIKNPQYNESYTKKLENVRTNMLHYESRASFEKLILVFEELMDQCEAELSTHGKLRRMPLAQFIRFCLD